MGEVTVGVETSFWGAGVAYCVTWVDLRNTVRFLEWVLRERDFLVRANGRNGCEENAGKHMGG
jgi:hypothetical protein